MSNMKILTSIVFCCFLFLFNNLTSDDQVKKVRVGSLQYGSVNWELKLIKEIELDKKNNFELEIVELASKNAAAVALQGKAVDLIVTDWFWVSRQRSEDRNFTFVPHSMAAGGLIVSKDSKILTEMDLKDKKIGVAGGQVDKGLLIFRAYYIKKYGKDLIKLAKPIFGAPPLLNKKIEQKNFDAILTYWPYQAKLMTNPNFKKIINITDIIAELGIPKGMPVIGWVFKEDWANENLDKIDVYLKTSQKAKKLMLDSDDIWNKVKPNMNVGDDNELFVNLRDTYREGIPRSEFSEKQIKGAIKLYSILSEIGGKELVGKAKELSPGTFWKN